MITIKNHEQPKRKENPCNSITDSNNTISKQKKGKKTTYYQKQPNKQTNSHTRCAVQRLLTQARGNNTEAVSRTLGIGWADWCNVGARRLEGSLPSCVHTRIGKLTQPYLHSTTTTATVTPC